MPTPRKLAAVPDLEEELENLYRGPLESFTSTRNDLARRLQKAGQADAADRIRALKKPTVAVWTVNQLARRQSDNVAALVEAGRQLRRAQREALSGRGAEVLRQATAAERAAIRTLTRDAHTLLREEGRSASQQTLERIAATLRAVAVEPDAARLLSAGRLAGELDSPGFAAAAELAPAGPATPRGSAKRNGEAKRQKEAERRRLRARLDQLERRAATEEERAQRAEEAALQARDRANEAAAEAASAREELDRLA
jgi:hypothetical protein